MHVYIYIYMYVYMFGRNRVVTAPKPNRLHIKTMPNRTNPIPKPYQAYTQTMPNRTKPRPKPHQYPYSNGTNSIFQTCQDAPTPYPNLASVG